MREIIFRGKRKDTGELVSGNYVYNYKHGSHMIFYNCTGCTNAGFKSRRVDFELQDCEVDPKTICQYTGLTDKNGVKIFEGDIVSAPFTGYVGKKEERKGVVEFVNGAFSVNWNDSKEYGKNFVGYVNDIEVIGNIFDNP